MLFILIIINNSHKQQGQDITQILLAAPTNTYNQMTATDPRGQYLIRVPWDAGVSRRLAAATGVVRSRRGIRQLEVTGEMLCPSYTLLAHHHACLGSLYHLFRKGGWFQCLPFLFLFFIFICFLCLLNHTRERGLWLLAL